MDSENVKTFFILAIDGGGIRGVVPATILELIRERLSIDICSKFNMFAGTSTGAIIAASLACAKDISHVSKLYHDAGRSIFSTKYRPSFIENVRCLFYSKYDNKHLKNLLDDMFVDICFKDVSIPLLIPASDIGSGDVFLYKSKYSNEFTRDPNIRIADAVLASCSAPTFFDPINVGRFLLADGGLWANNPCLLAAIEAMFRLQIPMNRIKVLSIGTGHSIKSYGVITSKMWGFLGQWGNKRFIEYILSLQSRAAENQLKLLIGNKVLRLNYESDQHQPLDDVSSIGTLISRAERIFTQHSVEIAEFLEEPLNG